MSNDSDKSFDEVAEKLKELTAADVVGTVAALTVHHCVAAVVVTIAHNLMPTTTRKEKIQLYIASRAVSGMVADKAAKRMGKKAKKVTNFVQQLVGSDKTWKQATNEPKEPAQEEPAQ